MALRGIRGWNPRRSFLRSWLLVATLLAFAPRGSAQRVPQERPRARPPSELTGWAEWERAAEIFSRVKVPPAPPLAPEEALKTFTTAPGFKLELVAAEPLVVHPIFFEFDPDGRIWAVEYRGYMRDIEGNGEGDPVGRVVVLEDTDADGRADTSTVFLDGLVMPRTLAFVGDGVLVAEPPHLWYCQDRDQDLRADSKVKVGTYGRAGNPQHTANGLAYGIDNWMHSADWQQKHQFRDGTLLEAPALYRGQFGVSFDEAGRYVTCRESSPVEMDLIPQEYVRRNPALVKTWERSRDRARFGIAVPIGRAANECFPIRPTPGITLGGLELRDDGTLRTYTIVAGTGVYLGDQFPDDAYGNIFVPEAGGHLIGRLGTSSAITPQAARYYPDGLELLASTDERFRPMSVRTGPDGALYFADMYKGIIEHIIFMAPYIANQIKDRNLALGNDMGRIYRLVSTQKPIARTLPRLSRASIDTLVETLGHRNGWRRITAQRLLVEKRDPAAIPLLRRAIAESPFPLARLHALWTLSGMEALDWAAAFGAGTDAVPLVRAAALRLCEQVQGPQHASAFLERLRSAIQDPNESVRLQAVLSLGALRTADADAALAEQTYSDPAPLFRTAILSGVAGREAAFLDRLSPRTSERFLSEFAETIFDSRDAAVIERVIDKAAELPELLDGLLAAAPPDLSSAKPVPLRREPRIITGALKSPNREAREKARRLAELFSWPGGSAVVTAEMSALTPEQQTRVAQGRDLFTQLCAACHQPHGGGLGNVAPPLNGSAWVAGPPERLARVVLHGLYGPLEIAGVLWNHHMPGFRESGLTDEQIAAVLSYVRRAWDNSADVVEPGLVRRVRSETQGRELPWTANELLGVAADREPDLLHPAAASGEIDLPAKRALCYGERLAYRPALDILGPWRKENDVAAWRVQVPADRTYEARVILAADAASRGDRFVIETEFSRVSGEVPATGGYDAFHEIRAGDLRLRAGVNRVLLRPDGALRAELADIRALRLIPLP
jgi:mono/diheme cytochrome c family protein/glucose/arabinose dehydrogenase